MSRESTGLTAQAPDMPWWVSKVLIAAAIYNIVWGSLVILFPLVPFGIVGIPAPNYPAIVRCLGMIVGVYGVGYWIAARDPVTQWPLVFVGLLGKIFGPIGFVYAAMIGEFPWYLGVTILTNDLIWWIPFTAIILHAIRIQDARANSGLTLSDVLRESRTAKGGSLLELSQRQDLLVVCIRHSGCTYCREALDDLSRQRVAIEQAGVLPVVIHMSTPADGEAMLKRYGCEGIEHVSDPNRRVYRALELRLGTLTELLGVRAFWRALVDGVIFRYGFGPIIGNGLQLAGAFRIRNGQIVKAYRHRSTADRANYTEIACSV